MKKAFHTHNAHAISINFFQKTLKINATRSIVALSNYLQIEVVT